MKYRISAVSLLLLLVPFSSFGQCTSGRTHVGDAYVNHIINWSQTGDLNFTVTGAPPNVCGDLDTIRNGTCLVSPGWICTDSSGNAIRGPWSWSSQSGDQSDTDIHFDWPDGTATYFTTNHYWDKTCPTPTITSGTGRPPFAFSGTGSDGVHGAGFGSWTSIKLQFKYNTTGAYWDPSTGDYTATIPPNIFGTFSGGGTIGPGTSDSPSYSITWDGSSQIPFSFPNGSYTWTAIILDGDTSCQQSASETFFCTSLHPCQ
jgi:hypothetical protein